MWKLEQIKLEITGLHSSKVMRYVIASLASIHNPYSWRRNKCLYKSVCDKGLNWDPLFYLQNTFALWCIIVWKINHNPFFLLPILPSVLNSNIKWKLPSCAEIMHDTALGHPNNVAGWNPGGFIRDNLEPVLNSVVDNVRKSFFFYISQSSRIDWLVLY